MNRTMLRLVAGALTLMLVAAACSGDDGGGGDGGGEAGSPTTGSGEAEAIDHEAIGLWDDGPCDEALPPLSVGLMTVFESPVVSLGDQAVALEASAEAFNARGGANGTCIEVHTCDDGANLDQAVACHARSTRPAWSRPSTTRARRARPRCRPPWPRPASADRDECDLRRLGDQNAYPLDPSGTGGVFMHPAALVESGVTDIGLIRVDLPEASALLGLLEDLYAPQGVSIPFDTPVPAGTTDFTQFILGAEAPGVGGVTLNLGEQEAVQVARAGQQIGADLLIGAGLGTFSHGAVAEFGDFAEQMVFDNSYPPATFDLEVYDALRADLAASGDEALQPANMRTSPMRSSIGLYALLWMIRDAGMTDFTREGISEMLQSATDVPMLGIFGGEDWTPDQDHPGIFQRAGVNHYSIYSFDPDAPAPDGLEGNFVETGEFTFDEVLCGSPFGGPEPC